MLSMILKNNKGSLWEEVDDVIYDPVEDNNDVN